MSPVAANHCRARHRFYSKTSHNHTKYFCHCCNDCCIIFSPGYSDPTQQPTWARPTWTQREPRQQAEEQRIDVKWGWHLWRATLTRRWWSNDNEDKVMKAMSIMTTLMSTTTLMLTTPFTAMVLMRLPITRTTAWQWLTMNVDVDVDDERWWWRWWWWWTLMATMNVDCEDEPWRWMLTITRRYWWWRLNVD